MDDLSAPGLASADHASPKSRVYRILCACAAFLSLAVVIPINLFQNRSPWFNLLVALYGLVCIALYLGARRDHYHPLVFTLALVVALNVDWFLSGGSDGTVMMYFPAVFLMLIVFFRRSPRWVVSALLLVNLLGLLWLERLFPQWVVRFASPQDRFLDLMTGGPISIAACVLIGWIAVDSYHREHTRLAELNDRLSRSLAEIRTLRGLLPVCAWCKKIRDDEGLWQQVEVYLSEHTDTKPTHGICPECEAAQISAEAGDHAAGSKAPQTPLQRH